MSYNTCLAHLRMLGYKVVRMGENNTPIRQSNSIIFKKSETEIIYYNLSKQTWRSLFKNSNTLANTLNVLQNSPGSS